MQANLLPVYKRLLGHFGYQGWWPVPHYHPQDYLYPKNKHQLFEICIGAILAQSTSWKNVEPAIAALKNNKALSAGAIIGIPSSKLASIIHSAGYHNQKAKKLKEFSRFFLSRKEISRETLLAIWGIGKETADSMLLYGYKLPIFVVDAYTKRIMGRIGFTQTSYDELQHLFMEGLPPEHELFNEYHALLVELGKKNCKKIPKCKECPIKGMCKYGKTHNFK